jgi:hypothetical protein
MADIFSAAPLDLTSSPRRPSYGALVSPPPTSPAGEIRGWFQNLFSWRQSHQLRSLQPSAATRDEVARQLAALGVLVTAEDVGGRLALRCAVDDGGRLGPADASAPADERKAARFRVEFASAADGSFLPLASGASTPGLGGAARRSARYSPALTPAGPCECVAVLVQEKGSVATFRAVVARLRDAWTLDAPASAGWGAPPHGHFGSSLVIPI